MQIKKHYDGLDVIRGLSAIFIMLYHYTTRYSENPITEGAKTDWCFSIPWGCAAVTTFFMLSGFLGAKTLFLKDASITTAARFLWNRVVRLYPSFLCALCLTFTITNVFYPQGACSLHDAIYNLTMMPSLFGVESVDGAYWTLRVEWFFYFLIAASLLVPHAKIRVSILFFWLVSSVLLFFVRDVGIFKYITILVASKFSQDFIAGVGLYLILNKPKSIVPYIIIAISLINEFLWQDNSHFVFFCLTILIMCMIIFADSDRFFKNPIAKILKWYGCISYPMYLVHQMIGFTLIYYMQIGGFTSTFYILVPIVTATCTGLLIHKYIELPIIAKTKK